MLKSKLILLLVVLAAAGCGQMPDLPTVISPYRIDIQQGNVVTQEMLAKLKPGMTRSQVRFALGSPLIVDPFRTDRWDYVYTFQKQGRAMENRRIVVIFEDDKLLRVEGDVLAQDPAARSTGQPAKPEPAAPQKPAAGDAETPAKPASAAPEPQSASGAANENTTEEKGFFGRMLEKIGL